MVCRQVTGPTFFSKQGPAQSKSGPVHSSGQNTGTYDRQTDGQTDRQSALGYYSVLHCEQCGRAVKSHAILSRSTLVDRLIFIPLCCCYAIFVFAELNAHLSLFRRGRRWGNVKKQGKKKINRQAHTLEVCFCWIAFTHAFSFLLKIRVPASWLI